MTSHLTNEAQDKDSKCVCGHGKREHPKSNDFACESLYASGGECSCLKFHPMTDTKDSTQLREQIAEILQSYGHESHVWNKVNRIMALLSRDQAVEQRRILVNTLKIIAPYLNRFPESLQKELAHRLRHYGVEETDQVPDEKAIMLNIVSQAALNNPDIKEDKVK